MGAGHAKNAPCLAPERASLLLRNGSFAAGAQELLVKRIVGAVGAGAAGSWKTLV
jgi:hypothetical protein